MGVCSRNCYKNHCSPRCRPFRAALLPPFLHPFYMSLELAACPRFPHAVRPSPLRYGRVSRPIAALLSSRPFFVVMPACGIILQSTAPHTFIGPARPNFSFHLYYPHCTYHDHRTYTSTLAVSCQNTSDR